jgi:uncharacterized OsmC-like protein
MTIVYNRVKTATTDTAGRSIGEVRQHYFVVDDPSVGESMTAADYFVSGIAACASNHMELTARRDDLPLRKIEVALEARRDAFDTSTFIGIDLEVDFHGISEPQAAALLEAYTRHCPLYKTVAAVTAVSITPRVHP